MADKYEDAVLRPIETILIPPGEYEINGEMQTLGHMVRLDIKTSKQEEAMRDLVEESLIHLNLYKLYRGERHAEETPMMIKHKDTIKEIGDE